MDIIPVFLSLQNQLRVYHWQTQSHAQHLAFGGIYDALDPLIDRFIEVCFGKHQRQFSDQGCYNLKIYDYKQEEVEEVINAYTQLIRENVAADYDPRADSDLLNIKDEIVGELNKLKYLLTLS